MFCSKCGKENEDQARYCTLCGAALVGAMGPGPAVKTSGLAIAAFVVAFVGFVGGLLAFPGLVLSIMALTQVNRAKTPLAGRGLAIAGISMSTFEIMLFAPVLLLSVFGKAVPAAKEARCVSNMTNGGHGFAGIHGRVRRAPPSGGWLVRRSRLILPPLLARTGV